MGDIVMINFHISLNIFCVFLAVILDFILGDPIWLPHPIIYIGKLIGFLERWLRKHFPNNDKLKWTSLFMVFVVCAITYMVPYLLLKLSIINNIVFIAVNTLIIWTTLAAKSLHLAGIEVYNVLVKEDIEEARVKLSYIVGRDTTSLSKDEIIRGDVETIAENTSDGIIAPIIYAIIGGAPLAMMYKGINTMDSMVGYLNEKYKNIGFFPANIDDIVNFIPARLTGILMCFTAWVVNGKINTAFKIMMRDRKNHKSPNCAYPEGATAGALSIQLGGTNTYFGEVVEKQTIGDAIVPLSHEHIKKSIVLMYSSEILLVILSLASLVIF
jgi:adenosylcobinamide-phosphate synthase